MEKAYRRISEKTALELWLSGNYAIYIFPACFNDYRTWGRKFDPCPMQASSRPTQSLKKWFSENVARERKTLQEMKFGRLALFAVPRVQD